MLTERIRTMISPIVIWESTEPDAGSINRERYINVYRLEQCYGGPEEGGWYWQSWDCGASVEIDRLSTHQRQVMLSLLREQYPDSQDMPLNYQGDDHVVYIENRKAESETREVPRYE